MKRTTERRERKGAFANASWPLAFPSSSAARHCAAFRSVSLRTRHAPIGFSSGRGSAETRRRAATAGGGAAAPLLQAQAPRLPRRRRQGWPAGSMQVQRVQQRAWLAPGGKEAREGEREREVQKNKGHCHRSTPLTD